MGDRLPPLNPVRTFVAASRHASFSKTAEAMNVTQAAVSRQIGVLEAYLGGRAVPPQQAQHLADPGPAATMPSGCRRRFNIISGATEDAMFETERDTLNIRVYTTFATLWLVPRLKAFRDLHPDLLFNVTTSAAAVDFDHENVDLAIQIGTPLATGGPVRAAVPAGGQAGLQPRPRGRSWHCGRRTILRGSRSLNRSIGGAIGAPGLRRPMCRAWICIAA